jgi:2-polyprenyl-3-methyl-5-hydroxy-6-metoxy-1,4-benzoquinol methylase
MALPNVTLNQTYGWQDTDLTEIHSVIVPYLKLILPQLHPTPASAIDLGCGNGSASAAVASFGYDVVGVDVSPDGIQLAKGKWPNIDWYCHSLDDKFDFLEKRFEIAFSLDVVEHLYAPRNLFRRAQEVLRQDGFLIVTTPYHGYFKNLALAVMNAWDRHLTVSWDGGHIKFFSRATLCVMAKEFGFIPIKFQGLGRIPGLWKSMVIVFAKSKST